MTTESVVKKPYFIHWFVPFKRKKKNAFTVVQLKGKSCNKIRSQNQQMRKHMLYLSYRLFMTTRFSSGIFVDFLAYSHLLSILFSPTQTLLGSEMVDVWNHSWGGYWWAQSLQQGELPWYTTLLTWPNGGVLWFIDPILAVISAPFAFVSFVWLKLGMIFVCSICLLEHPFFCSSIGRTQKWRISSCRSVRL